MVDMRSNDSIIFTNTLGSICTTTNGNLHSCVTGGIILQIEASAAPIHTMMTILTDAGTATMISAKCFVDRAYAMAALCMPVSILTVRDTISENFIDLGKRYPKRYPIL